VLVLATYRDEARLLAPLAQMLGELARVGVPRIMWNGLTLDSTAHLLARPPLDALRHASYDRSTREPAATRFL
jgi:hypothetical protein